MIQKRSAFALAVYVILTFAWAIIWNLILFKEPYQMATGAFIRESPMFALGLLAIVIQAVALVYLFEQYYQGRGLGEAILLTFASGVFTLVYASLVVPAKFQVQGVPFYSLLEAAYGGIHHTLAGLAFFWIYRAKASER